MEHFRLIPGNTCCGMITGYGICSGSMRKIIYDKFGKDCFIEDCSADKMPHKIPIRTTPDDERAIIIIDETEGKISTISEESIIIKSLTEKINIQRIYLCDRSIFDEVTRHVQEYVCFD